MLALSTAARRSAEPPSVFAKRALDLGADGVVLDPSIGETDFAPTLADLRSAGAPIAAVEAICPHPHDVEDRPRAGLFPLCAPGVEDRSFVRKLHLRTIELAADAGIRLLVVALGAFDGEAASVGDGIDPGDHRALRQ